MVHSLSRGGPPSTTPSLLPSSGVSTSRRVLKQPVPSPQMSSLLHTATNSTPQEHTHIHPASLVPTHSKIILGTGRKLPSVLRFSKFYKIFTSLLHLSMLFWSPWPSWKYVHLADRMPWVRTRTGA